MKIQSHHARMLVLITPFGTTYSKSIGHAERDIKNVKVRILFLGERVHGNIIILASHVSIKSMTIEEALKSNIHLSRRR